MLTYKAVHSSSVYICHQSYEYMGKMYWNKHFVTKVCIIQWHLSHKQQPTHTMNSATPAKR